MVSREEWAAMQKVARREQHKAYNASAKGKERNKRRVESAAYKTRVRRLVDTAYLSRPFIAVDGEGWNNENGEHVYTQLAFMSSADKEYHAIEDHNGLSTRRCLEWLLRAAELNPNGIMVCYGAGYDINMMLKDFPEKILRSITEREYTRIGPYRISWRAGKYLQVKHLKRDTSFRLYDVVSFFQNTFVRACDEYLGDKFVHRDFIVKSKMNRGTFTPEESANVLDYNKAELENLCALMIELRQRLHDVGLNISRWDGPGAIAAKLLTRENVKESLVTIVEGTLGEWIRKAYFGGRFEVIKFGHTEKTCYEYDINSAYPSAMRELPNLANGEWYYVPGPPTEPFSLVHLTTEWDKDVSHLPMPLPTRQSDGEIVYHNHPSEHVVWRPEYDAYVEYCRLVPPKRSRVIGSWNFRENDPTARPFEFVQHLYDERARLKALKDGANVAIKLGLNSLYGKLAQQLGARMDEKGEWKLPPFHCLEWAGYITSHCRATIMQACMQNLDAIIAIQTDAVFSSEPLDLPVSSNLGEWGMDILDDLTYANAGIYWFNQSGKMTEKSRGVDRPRYDENGERIGGGLPRKTVVELYKAIPGDIDIHRQKLPTVTAKDTRFYGLRYSLHINNLDKWRTWQTSDKVIKLGPTGKRVPSGPRCPSAGLWLTRPAWSLHGLYDFLENAPLPLPTTEHEVAWVNAGPVTNKRREIPMQKELAWTE